MGGFTTQFAECLPAGLTLPPVLADLLDWAESQGWTSDGEDGEALARLHASAGWPIDGTWIVFHVDPPQLRAEDGRHWLGTPDADVIFTERLVPFAQTGGDGSRAAFWRDDDGAWRIVHLGSGSGSTLACVLADTAEDFLRLVAIGYDELCWLDASTFAAPPAEPEEGGSTVNEPLRQWLAARGLTVPATAAEIVVHPAMMDDEGSPDAFCAWLARVTSGA